MGEARGRIAEVCQRLAEVFRQAVPLQPPPDKGKKRPTEKEITAATEIGLGKFYAAAREERERRRLGILGRARVAICLQQRLLEAGYPAPLVKQVLFAMLVSAFVGR